MIVILTAAYKKHGTFSNFGEVATHIMAIEYINQNDNDCDDDCQVNQQDWLFKHYDCRQVQKLYQAMKPSLNRDKLKQAYERRLPALEICSGQYDNPQFVAVTDEVNIDDQRKSWCFEYYKTKDYFIIECFDLVEFETQTSNGLSESLSFLQWLCDQDSSTSAYPYGIYIRVPYPVANQSIVPIINKWQQHLEAGGVV